MFVGKVKVSVIVANSIEDCQVRLNISRSYVLAVLFSERSYCDGRILHTAIVLNCRIKKIKNKKKDRKHFFKLNQFLEDVLERFIFIYF